MDILDIVLGGLLGLLLVAALPNNMTSGKPSLKRKRKVKKV